MPRHSAAIVHSIVVKCQPHPIQTGQKLLKQVRVMDKAKVLMDEAGVIAKGLEVLPAHDANNQKLEIEAQLDAAKLAQKRLLNFRPSLGRNFQCPRCWVRDDVRSALCEGWRHTQKSHLWSGLSRLPQVKLQTDWAPLWNKCNIACPFGDHRTLQCPPLLRD